jgi:hypothetical protein
VAGSALGSEMVGFDRSDLDALASARYVERMLYDVGRADHRSWKCVAAAGPWIDTLERLFEYPRPLATAYR